MVIIRDATNDDWPVIYPFFSQIVAEGRTIAYPEGLSSSEAADMWMAHAPSKTVVAVDTGGHVLGSAFMGPNRPGRGAHIATATFMVDPVQQGQGVGRALGHHAMSWRREQGSRRGSRVTKRRPSRRFCVRSPRRSAETF